MFSVCLFTGGRWGGGGGYLDSVHWTWRVPRPTPQKCGPGGYLELPPPRKCGPGGYPTTPAPLKVGTWRVPASPLPQMWTWRVHCPTPPPQMWTWGVPCPTPRKCGPGRYPPASPPPKMWTWRAPRPAPPTPRKFGPGGYPAPGYGLSMPFSSVAYVGKFAEVSVNYNLVRWDFSWDFSSDKTILFKQTFPKVSQQKLVWILKWYKSSDWLLHSFTRKKTENNWKNRTKNNLKYVLEAWSSFFTFFSDETKFENYFSWHLYKLTKKRQSIHQKWYSENIKQFTICNQSARTCAATMQG